MRKNKIVLIILSTLFVIVIAFIGTFVLWWNGAFDKFIVREIVSYEENGYTLIFQQLGDPQWPFGSTEVRLILKNQQGKVISKYDTSIQDDGANAGERNIASVEWLSDKVIVVLQASEMQDREIVIPFEAEVYENQRQEIYNPVKTVFKLPARDFFAFICVFYLLRRQNPG